MFLRTRHSAGMDIIFTKVILGESMPKFTTGALTYQKKKTGDHIQIDTCVIQHMSLTQFKYRYSYWVSFFNTFIKQNNPDKRASLFKNIRV